MIARKTPKEKVLELSKDCKRCGHCCRFSGCYVLEEDIDTIADYLNMDKEHFKKEYLEAHERFNTKVMKTRQVLTDKPFGPCIFLENNKCMINEVKPLHCRIGNCNEHGEKLMMWFTLNYFVNENDPESIRQWAAYLKDHKTIPGGDLSELVPDQEKLQKILHYKILK